MTIRAIIQWTTTTRFRFRGTIITPFLIAENARACFVSTSTTTTNLQLPSHKTTKKILKEHCQKRRLRLTTYSRGTAWSMALQIHRHDAHAPYAEDDRNLLHGLTPSADEEHDWKMRAQENNNNAVVQEGFGEKKGWKKRNAVRKRKMEKAIIHEKMLAYMAEAIQVIKDRGLWVDDMWNKSMNVPHVNPEAVLLKFSRLMAADLAKKDKEASKKKAHQERLLQQCKDTKT